MFVTCRSQSLGDQLQVFEAEAAVLKSWLAAARSKLTSIKQLSSTDLRSIATVRNKIDKILVSSNLVGVTLNYKSVGLGIATVIDEHGTKRKSH